jgi:molybdopterin-guanine dinucleotide biosynthesis protein A
MDTPATFAAMILCGGESRRMGRAKALLPWAGTTLLEHVVATLAPIAAPIVVVAAPEQTLPLLPAEVLVVRDAVAGEGPLRGLEAGLSALAGRADAAFVCGCDMPELSPQLITHLARRRGDHAALVVEHNGFWQPLHAFYRVDLLPALQATLATGERSLQRWLRTIDPLVVPSAALREIDPEWRSLRNVNTPEEYNQNR